jgi:hypothetical protein
MFIKFSNELVISTEHIVSIRKISNECYAISMISKDDKHVIDKQEYDGLIYLLGSMRSSRPLCDIGDPAVRRHISSKKAPDEPATEPTA